MYALTLSPSYLSAETFLYLHQTRVAAPASCMRENHDRFNNIGSSGESYS